MVVSFVFFMLLFLVIGSLSILKNQHTSIDYLVAKHQMQPWIVGLSAVATNNSGYMFIGMIGYTYKSGLSSMWLMIGWIFGDFIMSFLVHEKLRRVSAKKEVYSFAGILSRWHGEEFRVLRFIAGIITIVFLGTYAAAQFNAGSKSLHVLLGVPEKFGVIFGGMIVLLYCSVGGIRASFWTDVAQSIVMFAAMAFLVVGGIHELGGMELAYERYSSLNSDFRSLFPINLPLGYMAGPFLFILAWFFGEISGK